MRPCATCEVPLYFNEFTSLWRDETGAQHGPDRGDVPFIEGKINYWHMHSPDFYVIRQDQIKSTFDPAGRTCESCGGKTHDHDWMLLDPHGFAVTCSFAPNGKSEGE